MTDPLKAFEKCRDDNCNIISEKELSKSKKAYADTYNKKCKNIKGYTFGSHRKKFIKILKDKLKVKSFINLQQTLHAIFLEINSQKSKKHIIFFSPAGASFDSFKNFEERGYFFNQLIKKYINAKR